MSPRARIATVFGTGLLVLILFVSIGYWAGSRMSNRNRVDLADRSGSSLPSEALRALGLPKSSGDRDADGGASASPVMPSDTPEVADSDRRFAQAILSFQQQMDAAKGRAGEVIVTFETMDSYKGFVGATHAKGVEMVRSLEPLKAVLVHFETLGLLEDNLARDPAGVSALEANAIMSRPPSPNLDERVELNQTSFGGNMLAGLGVIGSNARWGRGVTIAVVDSGVAPDSTFGRGRLRSLDVGFGSAPGNSPMDFTGTAMAALAAGAASDAEGVSPNAAVLSVRVTDAASRTDIFSVARGIVAAVNAGAHIVLLGVGTDEPGTLLERTVDFALDGGAVIVAAASRDSTSGIEWPAADSRVISVGAIDAKDQFVGFAAAGAEVDINAPGYGVRTAGLNGERLYLDGTAASAPIVAGAIAAVLSEYPYEETYVRAGQIELSALSPLAAWELLQKNAVVRRVGPLGSEADYSLLALSWIESRSEAIPNTQAPVYVARSAGYAAPAAPAPAVQPTGTAAPVGAGRPLGIRRQLGTGIRIAGPRDVAGGPRPIVPPAGRGAQAGRGPLIVGGARPADRTNR